MTSALFCPVCPTPSELRVLDPHLFPLPLRRCDLCLGLLADPETVEAATSRYHESHYVLSEGHGRHHCRSCGAIFEHGQQRCRSCRKEQAIGCARCHAPMAIVEVAGVSIDVCRPCRMVWFDRGELGLLARRHAAALSAGLVAGSAAQQHGSSFSVVDGLDMADAAAGVAEGAHAVADVAISAVAEGSGTAVVDVVVSVGEGAVEVTGAALEVLGDVLGSLF